MDDRSGDIPLSGRRQETDPTKDFPAPGNFPRAPQRLALPRPARSIACFPQARSVLPDGAHPAARIPAAGLSIRVLRVLLQSRLTKRIPPRYAHRQANVPDFPFASRLLSLWRASPIAALPQRTTSMASARKHVFPIPLPPTQSARACDPGSRSTLPQCLFVFPAFRDSPCSVSLWADGHPSIAAFRRAVLSPAHDRSVGPACPPAALHRALQCANANLLYRCPTAQSLFRRSPSPRRTAPQCSGSRG